MAHGRIVIEEDGDRYPTGHRKISETLLDFAKPLIKSLPGEVSPEKMKRTLELAAIVWNAVCLTAWNEGRDWIGETRASLTRDPALQRTALPGLFEALLRRKRMRRFTRDLRAVSDIHVRWSDDGSELRVRAVARLAEHLLDVR